MKWGGMAGNFFDGLVVGAQGHPIHPLSLPKINDACKPLAEEATKRVVSPPLPKLSKLTGFTVTGSKRDVLAIFIAQA